jgi:hypothetical protein
MTHEKRAGLGGEPPDGPEHDARLPDASEIPEYDDVDASMAPPLLDVTPLGLPPETEYVGADPGWWNQGSR